MRFSESLTFWRRLVQPDAWPGPNLFQALAEKFLSRVDVIDPLALSRIYGRPCLYLANHQVYLESMLFNVALAPLQGRPVVALAKSGHSDRWLGRFLDIMLSFAGLRAPAGLEYFDRESSTDLVRAVGRLEEHAVVNGQSVLVHVEGTRRRSARRGRVRALSPLWPEIAVRNRWAVVPVRFVGGLPVDDLGVKLEAPVGFGSQTIRVGAPIAPEELAGLCDSQRVAVVRGAINALCDAGERPEPPDPVFSAAVQEWVDGSGVDPMAAAILHALVRLHRAARASAPPDAPVLDPVCDALVAAAEHARRTARPVVVGCPRGIDAGWLERLTLFLFGARAVTGEQGTGAALQAG